MIMKMKETSKLFYIPFDSNPREKSCQGFQSNSNKIITNRQKLCINQSILPYSIQDGGRYIPSPSPPPPTWN